MSIINQRAMLVRYVIRKKDFRKFDQKISQEVAEAHGADPDKTGRYNKILIAREYLEKMSRISGRAYTHHIRNTLPWDDAGSRVLPSKHYFTYANEQRAFRDEFDLAASEFISLYPSMIEEAKVRLGGMFSASDYPAQTELYGAFKMETIISAVPDKDDFRVDLDPAERESIKRDIEQRMAAVVSTAIGDLWNRLHESLVTLRDRLDEYEAADRKMFFSAWIMNVKAIVDLIPSLNFTEDQTLEAIRKRAESEILKYESDELRDIPEVRRDVANAADDILATMAGYMGS